MNYTWDIIIRALNEEVDLKELTFLHAKKYSAYMELSLREINFNNLEKEIEINPYYRYDDIFRNLFNINYTEDKEYREKLLDITVHFLNQIDIWSGMHKEKFYKKFILKDIYSGFFGKRLQENIDLFKILEKNILVDNIYKLYKTGDALYFFKDSIKRIFKNSIIYANYDTTNEILIYLNYEKTEENYKKIEIIKELFLPLQFNIVIYWKYHFGVIEVKETMKIEEISIY